MVLEIASKFAPNPPRGDLLDTSRALTVNVVRFGLGELKFWRLFTYGQGRERFQTETPDTNENEFLPS